MFSNVSSYQLKTGCHIHKMLYANFTATTKQNFVIANTQNKMRMKLKYTLKKSILNREDRRQEQRRTTKKARKQ